MEDAVAWLLLFLLPTTAVAADPVSGGSATGRGDVRYVASEALDVRSKAGSDDGKAIVSLPPAHRVEIVEPAGSDGWVRIQATIGNDAVDGFVPEAQLRDPLPAPREALVQAAVAEWLRFDRGTGKWPQPPYDGYVDQMWDVVPGAGLGVRRSGHWSAAFTSFLVHQAGDGYQGFRPSGLHADYIIDAFQQRQGSAATKGPFIGHLSSEYPPRPGDLIAQCREDFAARCDPANGERFKSRTAVVVASTGCYVTTIGGAEDASVQMRHYPIDAKGFLKPSGTVFAVLENRAEPRVSQ